MGPAKKVCLAKVLALDTMMEFIMPEASTLIQSILTGESPKLASLESGLLKLVLRVVRRRSDAIQAQAFRNAHNA